VKILARQDLEALIEAARSDPVFLRKCTFNFEQTLAEENYNLSEDEINIAKQEIDKLSSMKYREAVTDNQPKGVSIENILLAKQTQDRVIKITLDTLENATGDARIAFKNLRFLSNLTFGVGLSLFVLAAISGLILQRETFSLVFGGLGTTMIIAVFVTKPKEEIQTALSNLLQAETIFLDFYDQLHFWAPYASNGTLEERKQASKALDEAATFALQSLQYYIEPGKKTHVNIPKREGNN
jgi:hypothetical protein